MKWKLGTVSGIGIYIHWSFWLLPAWILLSSAGGMGAALSTVVFVFAIFGCVILHELGHALMARHFHIGTRDITLYPIGGVASLHRIPRQPTHELAIALAGPAVNVVIAAVLYVLLSVIGAGSPVALIAGGSFLANLLLVNIGLVVFNMLPAFPMDGGRVLRAFLAMRLPYLRATEIAVRVGQVVALALGLAGLFTGGTLVLVALFVFLAAQAELSSARYQQLAPPDVDPQTVWPSPPHPRNPQPDSGIVWLETDDGRRSGYVRIVRSRF